MRLAGIINYNEPHRVELSLAVLRFGPDSDSDWGEFSGNAEAAIDGPLSRVAHTHTYIYTQIQTRLTHTYTYLFGHTI